MGRVLALDFQERGIDELFPDWAGHCHCARRDFANGDRIFTAQFHFDVDVTAVESEVVRLQWTRGIWFNHVGLGWSLVLFKCVFGVPAERRFCLCKFASRDVPGVEVQFRCSCFVMLWDCWYKSCGSRRREYKIHLREI